MAMRPVHYELKKDPTHIGEQVGFISEEVNEVDPRLVSRDSNGDPMGVRYMQYTAVLTLAIQEQQHEIEELKEEIIELKETR